jgi:hypothetical protein
MVEQVLCITSYFQLRGHNALVLNSYNGWMSGSLLEACLARTVKA